MRPPIDKMVIRTALHEEFFDYKDKLDIKRSPVGGAFGKVRSSGSKPHQGWDLYAPMNAPVYSICDGMVVNLRDTFGAEEYAKDSFGNFVCILLTDTALQRVRHKFRCDLFAFYGHLADVAVESGDQVRGGYVCGHVGRSGNAAHSPSHLHFEIRTIMSPPKGSGLKYRIDPGEICGFDHYSSDPGNEGDYSSLGSESAH